MIDSAINHIANKLNQHLMRTFDLSEDAVAISNVIEQDGTVATHVNNKIVASLVNIEKDTTPFRQSQAIESIGTSRAVATNPPIYFNIYILFASCFSGNNYQEGLKFISNTIGYFQSQPVFDHSNSPGLPDDIEKLILDIENLDINDLSNLWGVLSGKYLPSILYKVRMITYDSGVVVKQTHSLNQPVHITNSDM